MTCAQLRPMLAERSLGGLSEEAVAGVDRHLAWCAACRKEARELDEAATSLVYALAPAPLPDELEELLVGAVRSVATTRAPVVHRRGRTLVAATVAAMLAVAGLGFGSVMAGRAARFRDQAATSKIAVATAQSTFRDLLRSVEFSDPRNTVKMSDLAPVGNRNGNVVASGVALALLAPTSQDMAIVTVSSLRLDPRLVPLEVSLTGPHRKLIVGEIAKLDSGGSATLAASLGSDLSHFDSVVVRDAKGDVVLRGGLTSRTLPQSSPSP